VWSAPFSRIIQYKLAGGRLARLSALLLLTVLTAFTPVLSVTANSDIDLADPLERFVALTTASAPFLPFPNAADPAVREYASINKGYSQDQKEGATILKSLSRKYP
jgi:hypothetical protein